MLYSTVFLCINKISTQRHIEYSKVLCYLLGNMPYKHKINSKYQISIHFFSDFSRIFDILKQQKFKFEPFKNKILYRF